MSITTAWNGLSRNKKIAVGAGAAVLLLLAAAGANQQGQRPTNGAQGGGYGPAPQGYGGGGYGGGQQNAGYGGGPGYQGQQAPQGPQPYPNGYQAGPAYQAPAYGGGGQAAYGGGGGGGAQAADDSDPTGYWARQRSQEQQATAFDQTIRETNTVRGDDGTVYTGVPNEVADPAIAGGNYTQVPTNELPTNTPTPEPAAAPEPAPE